MTSLKHRGAQRARPGPFHGDPQQMRVGGGQCRAGLCPRPQDGPGPGSSTTGQGTCHQSEVPGRPAGRELCAPSMAPSRTGSKPCKRGWCERGTECIYLDGLEFQWLWPHAGPVPSGQGHLKSTLEMGGGGGFLGAAQAPGRRSLPSDGYGSPSLAGLAGRANAAKQDKAAGTRPSKPFPRVWGPTSICSEMGWKTSHDPTSDLMT